MKRLCQLLLFLAIAGCASENKVPNLPAKTDPNLVKRFEEAYALLEQEKYPLAASAFEDILTKKPTSEFEAVVFYNAGAAYEGMKDCKTAATRYRRAVVLSRGKLPQIEVQALYRLSYVYECLGSDTKVISSLLDVKKRDNYLTDDLMKAELPARLAAAYGRVGNREQAKKYFTEAEIGLRLTREKYKESARPKEIMARILFFMGRLNPPENQLEVKTGVYLENLRQLQPYLWHAVELDEPNWSKRAAEQIDLAYKNVWRLVDREKPDSIEKDTDIVNRKLSLSKNRIVQSALISLRELKNLKLPNATPGRIEQDLTRELKLTENKFVTFLAQNAEPTNPLTSDAKRREGLRREGRVISSPTPLEEQRPAKKNRETKP